ncbi:uncharacterized protein LOC107472708 isoform X4 [Arachis duranensis]|uniref:Uncharacterized protein LOC107472708 isoform X4 n=1 Tax=Arachis duranensis TaxID=130453 RepID=A0A6P5N5C1_ARADU|nr:uncharacterized protein LOC107472708 isoform X4 [Arachis duranensis]
MVLQFLKHPFTISRGFHSDTTLTILSRFPTFNSPVRCVSAQIPTPFKGYATANSEKVLPVKKKKRLDEICLEKYQQYSRSIIQSWILQGKVHVNGKVVNKAGTPVSEKAVVEIIAEVPKYVCRAGHKLEAAIEQLGVNVAGKVALDSGLSTGGFTDCLLQYGASHVYGVDVGYGQVAEKIRRDDRVSIIERTNLRYLTELPQNVDLVTLDLSFISILLVGKGGIVKDPSIHQEVGYIMGFCSCFNKFSVDSYSKVLDRIIKGVEDFGFCSKGWIESPLKGAEGNTEFLVHFTRTSK